MADTAKPTNQTKSQFSLLEEELIPVWENEKVFEKSIENRVGGKRFRFYDGPPFTSGPPHYGHVEQSSLKDAMARYKTMQGYYVPRRTGCDTHGLPIENLVEKEKGFRNKKDIVAYGIDKFNADCRAVVFRHKDDFTAMYQRLGRGNDPSTTYATLDDDYIESVWWAFGELYKKGLIYKGFKSVPYCPRCATPLSNFEMNDGYKDDVSDPSVYVKFWLQDEPKTALVAWTTTPWTLPANAALAVDEQAEYLRLQLVAGEILIVAKARVKALNLKKEDYKVEASLKGKDLVGLVYQPLFTPVHKLTPEESNTAFRVYHDDSVSLEDGTGILHVAPRYGETDLAMGQRLGLPMIESVGSDGLMNKDMGSFKGMFFKKADEHIIADLTKKGLVFAAEEFTHTYPFCWRCETPLMYFATDSWFVAVTKIKEELYREGEEIKWIPAHVQRGRWLKWLEGARDWAISRTRFWGAPLPVWENTQDTNDRIIISSIAELKELSGQSDFDMHRPGIDNVIIEKDGKTYQRVEEVFDCWFESGSMPYGQDHYPFENKEDFEASFPADFICEAIEMVHLWFYTLHVMGVALTGKHAYQNVIASGLILAADGKKLSKRLRNYPPIEQLLDRYGADTTRFFVLSSPLMNGQDTRLTEPSFRDIYRNIFTTLFNSFTFFKTYTDIDKWQPPSSIALPRSTHILDTWILARLDETIAEVTKQADKYEVSKATRPITELIDDLSNWYIRRSRRRFWKSEDDADKQMAYETLWYVLLRTCQLLAPWAPFLSDHIWRQLVAGTSLPTSVHLSDWPTGKIVEEGNQTLVDMAYVRGAVALGLSKRAEANIKVRQPLSTITILNALKDDSNLSAYTEVIQEELNVKNVIIQRAGDMSSQERQEILQTPGYASQDGGSVEIVLDLQITDELKREGLMREVVRHVQSARKSADLSVEDRIRLVLTTADKDLQQAIDEHRETIMAETLALDFTAAEDPQSSPTFSQTVTIEGADLTIHLDKMTS